MLKNEEGTISDSERSITEVTKYTYDANGNCTSEELDSDNDEITDKKWTVTYDRNNHITSFVLPDEGETEEAHHTLTLGNLGLPVKDKCDFGGNGTTDYVLNYEYNSNGKLLMIEFLNKTGVQSRRIITWGDNSITGSGSILSFDNMIDDYWNLLKKVPTRGHLFTIINTPFYKKLFENFFHNQGLKDSVITSGSNSWSHQPQQNFIYRYKYNASGKFTRVEFDYDHDDVIDYSVNITAIWQKMCCHGKVHANILTIMMVIV